jgi:hypothetical protein
MMSESAYYCPKCGVESGGDTRYCRRCGTNLEIVGKALSVPALADDELARAERAFRMRLVRGLGLLVLAAGAGKGLLALIIAAMALGGPVSLWTVLGLIVFGVVPAVLAGFAGCDLLQAYELRKDPRGALAALPTRRPAELADGESDEIEASRGQYLSEPASVTEDTTLRLARSSDDDRGGRFREIE